MTREFEGIEVTYPPEDICIYPEYKGKPYFGIKYKENGEEIVGYGTYKPEVLSQYLKDYFIPATKNDLGVDCVSRADAERILTDLYHSDICDYYPLDILEDIKALPSVTPQECKVSKWIFVGGIKGKDNVEKCSCCGSHWKEAIIYRTDTQEYLRTRLLYCPNCGSRNEVEE